MAYLEIKGISKSYGTKKVLNNINLSIDKGSFISLLGLSGCGKTTLLRIIAGLEQADVGTILLDEKDITNLSSQERNIGIVFQNYALFPHLTVEENITYGLTIQKRSKGEINRKVSEILDKVNLAQKAKQNVSSLSGGEQQRVALARSIVTEPQIILLDEPLSNLDHSLRLQARNELKRLQNDIGITSVYVTHDQSEALALSDKIAVMNLGEIVQTGTPKEIYFHPGNFFTADFVGHYNIFNQQEANTLFNKDIPADALLAILPEQLNIDKAINKSTSSVKDVLFSGAFTEYILATETGHIVKVLSPAYTAVFSIGEYVSLSSSSENMKIIPLK